MSGYRGRYFERERVWVCGDYLAADLYPVFQPPGRRRKKCNPTRAVQELINQRDAESKLDRLIKLNFREGDLALHLTLREPVELPEAVRLLRAYLRRVRRIYKKAGVDLKYVYVLERGGHGRIDMHLVLNAGPLSRDELEAQWAEGYANARRLQWDEKGVSAFVGYITKARRRKRRVTYRRWSCSKNLIRPEPEVRDGKITATEMAELTEAIERRNAEEIVERMYPGYKLVEAEAVRNAVNRGVYIRLRLARPECWHGRPPRADYLWGETGEDYADE